MKRFISIILTIFLCALFAACLSSCSEQTLEIDYSDTYIFNQDYQYDFADGYGNSSFQKSESGYYASINSFLFFIDGDILQATPLCNKSNCLHDKETDPEKLSQCNAYIADYSLHSQNTIQYCNDRIYIMTEDFAETADDVNTFILCEINPETCERKNIFEYNGGTINKWFIHRGNLYFYADNYSSETNEAGEDIVTAKNGEEGFKKLYKVKLYNDTPQEIFDFEKDMDWFSPSYYATFTFYGNHMYIAFDAYKDEEAYNKVISDENGGSEDMSQYITSGYIHINLLNDSNSEILTASGDDTVLISGFKDNKILLKGREYSQCDLDGGNRESFSENTENGYIFYDGQRLLSGSYKGDGCAISVLDENYETTAKFTLPVNYYVEHTPQLLAAYDSKYIWGCIGIPGDDSEIICIDKAQFDSQKGGALEYKTLYECKGVSIG